jgi:hypothetical protein
VSHTAYCCTSTSQLTICFKFDIVLSICRLIHIYKGKGHPITGHPGPRGGVEIQLYSFSTSALGGGGWSVPRPGHLYPGKDPVPIVQVAGWASGPVWTCAKDLAPTGIRSPDRPARSQSLYRPSYPAHVSSIENINSFI